MEQGVRTDDNEEAHHAELRAINEKLIIAGIREQERAEAAAKSADTAFKSGELYRMLAQNFPNGVVLLFDHDLRHTLADGTGMTALGLLKEGIEGKTIWEGFPTQTAQQMEPAYRAALKGETIILEVHVFIEQASPERQERTYQVQVLPVRDDTGNILAGMAMAQDVTEQRQAENTIRWQAHHDPLTGLPNRILLCDRLERALAMCERSGKTAGLLFLDIDRFKQINDMLGHDVGDRVLQAVAARLTDCLRAEDTVARLGGDEFLVLLPSLHAPEDAAHVAQKIMVALAVPLRIGGHKIPVTASVGVSLFPRDGRDADTLMRSADAAMYKLKKQRATANSSATRRRTFLPGDPAQG